MKDEDKYLEYIKVDKGSACLNFLKKMDKLLQGYNFL